MCKFDNFVVALCSQCVCVCSRMSSLVQRHSDQGGDKQGRRHDDWAFFGGERGADGWNSPGIHGCGFQMTQGNLERKKIFRNIVNAEYDGTAASTGTLSSKDPVSL